MKQKIDLYLFDKHIGQMYQDGDRVYLKQINNLCHQASPLLINKDISEIETTKLIFIERVAGFISDSLPGNFGNEILTNFFLQNKSKIPTVSDKLIFIGNKGLGALRFQPCIDDHSDTEITIKLKDMFEKSKELKKTTDYHTLQSAFLISAHSFVGGARSKAVTTINLNTQIVYLGDRDKKLDDGFIHAIIKYDDTAFGDEDKSTYSKIEYVYHLLAKKVGIDMMDCYLLQSDDKYHFVTKRFDRDNCGKRYHVHSLAGLLHIDYNIPRILGYEDLLRTSVKLGALSSIKQLFLQMIFNYMFVNQDDHARNFSFMCDETFKWKATPAYDITFAKGERQTVEHQLSLYGKELSKIGIDDIVKLASEFSIDLDFVANSLNKMKEIRDTYFMELLKEYNISNIKQKQIFESIKTRDLKGELNE
ncbi:MAG: HipA domain-containing protein [Campylobacterota bacterium]|nr:HipA domain-containing protein [Campylobacterota bacterium]